MIDGKSVISEEDPIIAYNFTGITIISTIVYKFISSILRSLILDRG